MKKTRVFFGSYKEAEYNGAAREVCSPAWAASWHCTVGSVHASMTKGTIGVHMPDMLRLAYEAGVNDTVMKAQLSLEKLFFGDAD